MRNRVTSQGTNVSAAFDSYVRGLGALTHDGDPTDTAAAVSLLEEAIRRDVTYCAARGALARALGGQYRQTRDAATLDTAFEQVRRVLERRPSAPAYEVKAELCLLRGDHGGAISALERAVELAPDSGAAHHELAQAYGSAGLSADAEREYQRSAALRPGYWPSVNQLGALYLARGGYDAAANAWREVTLYAPLYTGGYANLGAVYLLTGHAEQAQAVFERSIEIDPANSYAAYTNLGSLYFDQARFADAVKMFRKALELEHGDFRVWGNLAYASAFGADPEAAHDLFQRAIELGERRLEAAGDDLEVLSRLAGYYATIGDADSSRSLLRRTIAIDPSDPRVLGTVAETFEDLGDREHALEWVEKALAAGAYPGRFARSPTLRGLVDDERYRRLVERYSPTTTPTPSGASMPDDL